MSPSTSDRKPDDIAALRSLWSELADDAASSCAPEAEDITDESRIETMWKALSGELPVEERRDLVERLAADPAAAEDWRIAREMFASESVQHELEQRSQQGTVSGAATATTAQENAHRSWFRVLWPFGQRADDETAGSQWWPQWSWQNGLAAAAVVLLVVAMASVSLTRLGSRDVTVREAPTASIVSLIPDGSGLARDAFRLRWQGLDSSSSYTVRVTTLGLANLFLVENLQVTEVLVPPSALAEAASGDQLLWNVEATSSDGTTVSSDTFVVRLD